MKLFGQFVGDWECTTTLAVQDGSTKEGRCEWHFGWTLEGKAVQDVWIARYGKTASDAPPDAYGTTLRWYDPQSDVWHIFWLSARDNITHTFIAHQVGAEIVLDGQDHPEHPYRWVLSQIATDSFRGRSESSFDHENSWVVGQRMAVWRACEAGRRPEPDRANVETLERDWLAHESDRATLERILADDFVHVVPVGLFLTKEQHIDWAVQHPLPKDRRAKFEDLRIRVNGDTAIATGILANVDEAGADVRRTLFTDVFIFRAGAWKAVNAQENATKPGT